MAVFAYITILYYSQVFLLLIILSVLALLSLGKFRWSSKMPMFGCVKSLLRHRALPGPRGYPLVGHLPMLGTAPHKTLTHWSRVYGQVYQLRFGLWPVVILNGYQAAYEALVKQGDTFASRPAFHTFQHYAQGASMSFHRYDRSLRAHRKLTTTALKACALGGTQMDSTEDIIRREGMQLLQKWKNRGEKGIDPTNDLILAVAGVLYSICFGHELRVTDDQDYVDILTAVNPATELFGAGNHVDVLPFSSLFRRTASHQNNIRRMQSMSQLNQKKCEEHKGNIDLNTILGFMMSASQEKRSDLTGSQMLNTTVEFLSAGTETSSATLLWLLLYMVRYPEVAKQVAAEIHDVLGDDHLPSFADRIFLPYTEATMLEVMRLTTIVPFALPHSTLRPTQLGAYHIPKDTLVFVNLWSVNRDLELWDQPDAFRPERFLIQDEGHWVVDREVTRRVMSFGAGKRKCIGETLGRVQVFILFTLIMQKCQILNLPGAEYDLEGIFGDILKPKPYTIQMSIK